MQQMRVVVCVCLCVLLCVLCGTWVTDSTGTLAGMKDYSYLAIYV